MSILVEAGDGHAWRSLCVLAEADLTMSYAHQLKSAVEALTGTPAELQHLFLGRKKITDTLSLAGQGLQPGAVVRLQIPLLAGDPGSIKVTGLDPNVTEADLSTAFDDYGDIKSVKLIPSKDPNKPNHCFINFATLQDAESAIAGMQGRVIGQQRIHCTLQQQQSQGPSSSSVVYPVKVGNLSDRVTESMLRQAFGMAGTILNVELKPGDPPYAFVNYQNEADVRRAVNQFHRQVVCGVKVNVIEKPQRTVSKAGPTSPLRSASASMTTSTTPRRIPQSVHTPSAAAAASHYTAPAMQHSPQQAIVMVSEHMGLSHRQLQTAIGWQRSGRLKNIQGDGKFSLRRKDKVLVCEASTAAIAKKQLDVAKRLLERPDQGYARINLADCQRKFMEARKRQYLQALQSDYQVQISLGNFIDIVGPQDDVDRVEDELRCYVDDLVTHKVPIKRHFKLERPLAAKYQQVKKQVEQWCDDVYLEVPSMDQLRGNAARGPGSPGAAFGQDCTVLCMATRQSDLDGAVQKIKQVDMAVVQSKHPISPQDGGILIAGIKSHKIDVAAFNANIHIQQDHAHITALSASDVDQAKRAMEVYLESEKDGHSTFYFSSVAVGQLVVAFHMDKVSRIAQTHSVSVKVDVPKVPAVTSQSATLHISGKLASVKQCIVDLEEWQSTLRADKSSCKVTGLAATALPECLMDIDELAKRHVVLCDLNDPVEQLTMAVKRARISPAQPVVPRQAFSAMVWEWMDDDGWKPYDQQTCQLLTKAQVQGTSCRLKLQGASYIVDPVNLRQRNEASRHRRKIRCIDPSGSTGASAGSNGSYKWQFLHEIGHFADFLPSDSSRIENAYLSGQTSLDLSVGKWTYTIYVRQGHQVNTMTGTQRQVQRVPVHSASTSTVAASDAGMSRPFKFSPCLMVEISVSASTLVPNTSAYLMTPAKAPSNFLSSLGHRLQQAVEEKKIVAPPGFNTDIQDELKALAVSQLVGIEYQIAGASRQFVVTGSKKRVLEAANQVQGLILKNVQSAGSAEAISFPKEWKLPCEDLELVPVSSYSREFTTIVGRIQETLPNASIDFLQRIQNKFLWRKFVQNRQEIREVNGRSTTPKEKLLFHGTRQTEPEKVYRNQEGFDMRFSASGLWGRANYFAEDAAYSHGYSHKVVAGMKLQRQMLLALVTVGESIELAQEGQRTRPPIRIPAGSQVHGDILYDTVNGITNQRRVYMTYNNRQAYPFYLITYTSP